MKNRQMNVDEESKMIRYDDNDVDDDDNNKGINKFCYVNDWMIEYSCEYVVCVCVWVFVVIGIEWKWIRIMKMQT